MSRLADDVRFLATRNARGELVVTVDDGDRNPYPLEHRVLHSPTGFECGYAGSGPADLARSICWDYQAVKVAIVARAPREGFAVTVGQVRAAMRDAVLGIANGSYQAVRACRGCGCTEDDCREFIRRTGSPCFWVERDLCSACVPKS